MRRLAFAAVLALFLSMMFAWLAWYFQVVIPNEARSITFMNPTYVSFMAYTEIAEGFAVAGAAMLLIWAGGRLCRVMPSVGHALTHPVVIGQAVERLVLLLSIAAIGAYSFMVFLEDAHWIGTYYGGPTANSLALLAGNLGKNFSFQAFQSTGSALGCMAFLAAAVATFGLTVYRLEKGLASAIGWAFKLFTLPGVIALEVGLLLCYNPPIVVMADHVTNFAVWSYGGVYVLSNWATLVISVSLEALLLSERWWGREVAYSEDIVEKRAEHFGGADAPGRHAFRKSPAQTTTASR